MSLHAHESAATLEAEPTNTVEPLAPVLSLRWALTWRHAAVAAFLAASFILQAYFPLKPYGVFRDLTDARAMLAAGALPARDPLLPYAESARYALLNYGGSLLEAVVWRLAGAEGIAATTALLAFAATLLWCRIAYRQFPDPLVAIPVALVCFGASWGTLGYAGTSLFGRLLLPALILVLQNAGLLAVPRADSLSAKRRWLFASPVVFAIWANLDPSWVVGLGVFAAAVVGHAVSALSRSRRGRSARSVALDGALALSCSAAATLLNPYGWKLWGLAALPYENNPFAAELGGLAPVPAWSLTGAFVAIGLCGAAVVLSRRAADWSWADRCVLAFAVAGSFAHPLARAWTLPILAALIVPPLLRLLSKALAARPASSRLSSTPLAGRHFGWTLVSGLAVWTAVALTPLGNPLFGSGGRSLEQIVPAAPLSEIPADAFSRGVVFAPVEWAEAAAFHAANAGDGAERGATSPQLISDSRQAFLAPSMRGDLTIVLRVDPAWPTLLDRYDAKTLLLDPVVHANLIDALAANERWTRKGDYRAFVRFDREERVR